MKFVGLSGLLGACVRDKRCDEVRGIHPACLLPASRKNREAC